MNSTQSELICWPSAEGIESELTTLPRAFSALWSVSLQFRRIGVQEAQVGNKRQNAATAGTRGYGQASRRAFDWQQRCRSRSVA